MATVNPNEQFPYSSTSGSVSGDISSGYSVNPQYPGDKEKYKNAVLRFARTQANGTVQTFAVSLFVQDVNLQISLGGSTAQSKMIRQFYAHSINLPEMVVTCQARSSFEYNYIAEFIRFTQKYLVNNYESSGSATGRLVEFTLDPFEQKKGMSHEGKPNLGVTFTTTDLSGKPFVLSRRGSDGSHTGKRSGFIIQCYITNVSRMVQTGQNAYDFNFTVTIVNRADGFLPFSKNDTTTNSIEGIQWTAQEIDLAAANGISFVQPPKISIGISKPHSTKKKGSGSSNGSKTPTTPPPILGSLPSTLSTVINQPISQIGNLLGF